VTIPVSGIITPIQQGHAQHAMNLTLGMNPDENLDLHRGQSGENHDGKRILLVNCAGKGFRSGTN
jgi:hypothetical protein